MKEMVEELKIKRIELEAAKEEYKSDLIKFDADHKELIEKKIELLKSMATLVNNIQIAALEEYNESGNNKPYPGIGIRVMKKLEYREDDAIKWAKEHDLALSLDTRMFETLAKSLRLDIVKEVDVPKATISTNL